MARLAMLSLSDQAAAYEKVSVSGGVGHDYILYNVTEEARNKIEPTIQKQRR
ncbi:MAG: hypothetical protein P0121_03295 [Nitrospira sp.]|nr:hypothetical protein [Nitrospira sp.]